MSPSPNAQHPLEPLRRTLRLGVVGLLVLAPVAGLLGWLVDGSAGLAGAMIGVLVPAVFFGLTAVLALVTLRLSPGALGGVVLGSWVLKLLVLIAVFLVLDQWDGWSRTVFAVTFLVGVIASLALEAVVVLRSQQPYVQPAANPPRGEA